MAARPFLATDTPDAVRVAVVSRQAAERFWPGRDPIGTSIRIDADSASVRIVGVAADAEFNW